MASSKTRNFPANGVSPVVIGQYDTGIDLAGPYGALQVSCSGLDGGTYKVEALVPENPDYMLESDANAANTVRVIAWPAVVGLKVTFAGTGPAAVPVVHLSQRGRPFTFGSGA